MRSKRTKNLKVNIGIIGAGVMGSIFADRLLKTKTVNKSQILVSRRSDDKSRLVIKAHILILALKPQDFSRLADQLVCRGLPSRTLIISIMAGVDIKALQKALGVKAIVRAMPNLPAKIGQGVTLWKASLLVSQKQRSQARTIFQSLGDEIETQQETMIDRATAVSGSGPAYVFLFHELMNAAARHLGLSKKVAERLVRETICGAVNLQRQSNGDPQRLREQVTSKGGTTAAALKVFKKFQTEEVFNHALQAAFDRAEELKKNSGA